MPHKSLSNPSFIRVGELMGADIQKALAPKADEVADLIALGIKKKRKTPANEAKKILKSLYEEQGLADLNAKRLTRALTVGANEVADVNLLKRQTARVNRILGNLGGTVELSSDLYLQRIVIPAVERMNNPTPDQVRVKVKKMMGEAGHYWDNVANTAASRSFHYGSMLAAEGSNLKKMMYHNPMDEDTTDFCEHINGKTVSLSTAIVKAEAILMQSPEEMLSDEYWGKVAKFDVNDMSGATLSKSGLLLPPFHGHCRTTTSFH